MATDMLTKKKTSVRLYVGIGIAACVGLVGMLVYAFTG